MTAEERAARDRFLAAWRVALRARARTFKDVDGAVQARLKDAAAAIAALLASQPEDWRQLQLTAVQGQVRALLDGMAGRAGTALAEGADAAWRTGIEALDGPLAAAQINVQIMMPALDTSVLVALKSFGAGRLQDLAAEAAGAIDRAIGLAVLGTQTPGEAMRAVQAQLGAKDAASAQRARTIVRTQLGQAYSLAHQARMEQAAELVPGLQKQWRRSGKIYSRWNHDAADGQVVDASAPFVLQSKSGPVKLMHPHDPKAPAAEVINCGCVSRPWLGRWGLPPGGTPFSEREQALNPLKVAGSGWLAGNAAGRARPGRRG